MSCLYILEINPLSVVSFAIIFSHSEGCLKAVQKLLSLIRSHLFILLLLPLFQEMDPKRNITMNYVKEYFAYVFS